MGWVMTDATLLTIRDRAREHPAAIASPEHFTLVEGQTAAPQLIIDEPGWSPYCLDDENRCVLFVNIPPDVDLSQAKFVYASQFEQAQRALMVPYAALEQLTEQVRAPDKLIFIFSMGRCGSTLMSQIVSQVEGVYSLSEPDVFTNLSLIRSSDKQRDELIQVLKSCTLLLSRRGNQSRLEAAAFKFRSHGLGLSDWLYAAFPEARSIFMYRNAVSWAQSVYRFLQRLGFSNQFCREDAVKLWQGLTGEATAYVEPYMDVEKEIFYFTDLLAPAWTSYLDRYMTNYERGVPFHTIRYEELNDQREASLKAVFEYCGLPTSYLQLAMQAFETDSQAGTAISRDVYSADLAPERIEQFLKLLSRHPRFADPNFVLPDSHSPRSA
jgi:hypothetical protein